MIARRSFLFGLGAAIAAPAIVRSGLIMPVRKWIEAPGVTWYGDGPDKPFYPYKPLLGDIIPFHATLSNTGPAVLI